MRALIQRVTSASVSIGGSIHSSIGPGLLILLGVEEPDTAEDAAWLAGKIAKLRIFADEAGALNLSIQDTGGGVLAVSQFTLFASTKKGNRPSFLRASRPEHASPLYDHFCELLERETGKPAARGVFGAEMQIALVNDGPVTIWIDTRDKQ